MEAHFRASRRQLLRGGKCIARWRTRPARGRKDASSACIENTGSAPNERPPAFTCALQCPAPRHSGTHYEGQAKRPVACQGKPINPGIVAPSPVLGFPCGGKANRWEKHMTLVA
ncbi:hypothetical protein HPB50_023992 [Hyalomma asiaticum]|uniref:Uncharacterized protein n=1 Tax=Hyalomma asiaticum TaxID=266040 RepID=A0ACB7SDZ8_HYAAI|nr:hypothetical protein HPB50_023992 [Hyalomma asiaticum]